MGLGPPGSCSFDPQLIATALKRGVLSLPRSRAPLEEEARLGVWGEECVLPLPAQVGGTSQQLKRDRRLLCLRDDDRFVLKPLQSKGRGEKELRFYEALREAQRDTDLGKLRTQESCPAYHGLVNVQFWKEGISHCIVLSNIAAGFLRPCILDLKLGQRTYEPAASLEKRIEEEEKYPLLPMIGFRYVGMRLHREEREEFWGKHWGKTLPIERAADGLVKFLHDGKDRIRLAELQELKLRVQSLIDWFSAQTSVHFISSSLLIAYDDFDTGNGCTLKAQIIDFGHSQLHQHSNDINCLYGLKKILLCLEILQSIDVKGSEHDIAERMRLSVHIAGDDVTT